MVTDIVTKVLAVISKGAVNLRCIQMKLLQRVAMESMLVLGVLE